eukprot:TRINITY_DN5164_c0_g6_i1.p2 TRINITY_DN5164_c0_g6~~TRINITY_DN5164_c0_g6_i1.p2  ORF type:complete len:227 (-),score=68.71 TRINITY_DN5164_c0_g6_i1:86-766(-)
MGNSAACSACSANEAGADSVETSKPMDQGSEEQVPKDFKLGPEKAAGPLQEAKDAVAGVIEKVEEAVAPIKETVGEAVAEVKKDLEEVAAKAQEEVNDIVEAVEEKAEAASAAVQEAVATAVPALAPEVPVFILTVELNNETHDVKFEQRPLGFTYAPESKPGGGCCGGKKPTGRFIIARLDKPLQEIKVGMIIRKINGVEVAPDTEFADLQAQMLAAAKVLPESA